MTIIKEKRLIDMEAKLKNNLPYNSSNIKIFCADVTNSTMDLARQFIMSLSDYHDGFVISKNQIAGRGRRGSKWVQAKEALYFTSFFKLGESDVVNPFALVAGLSVVDTCRKFDSRVFLKWPNDIYNSDKKKLGGILTEKIDFAGNSYLLTGIGVNFYFDTSPLDTASSLFEDPKGEDFLAKFSSHLYESLKEKWVKFSSSGFDPFKNNWLDSCIHLNSPVRLEREKDTIDGICCGVLGDGSLELNVNGSVQSVHSGSLFIK